MSRITEDKFNEIKKILDTPILTYPSVSQIAKGIGYSTGTVAAIKKADSFNDYKARQREYQRNYTRKLLNSEVAMISEERKKGIEEVKRFNNEWYFEGKD